MLHAHLVLNAMHYALCVFPERITMIIVVKPDATPEQIEHIIKKIKDHGLQAHVSKGTERTIIGAIGDEAILQSVPLEAIPGVEKVLPILKPFKLASWEFRREKPSSASGGRRSEANGLSSWRVPCAVEE